jgi:hypothetical protein
MQAKMDAATVVRVIVVSYAQQQKVRALSQPLSKFVEANKYVVVKSKELQ